MRSPKDDTRQTLLAQQSVPKEHTVLALGRLALAGLWPEWGASVGIMRPVSALLRGRCPTPLRCGDDTPLRFSAGARQAEMSVHG
jgi:hypothetical protein